MLPSMPILFTRDSQDAFGNKIEPCTSILGHKIPEQTIVKPPPPKQPSPVPPKPPPNKPAPKSKGRKKKALEKLPKLDKTLSDSSIAASYFQKVQSRFNANNRAANNKFTQFKNLLKQFDINNENPKDLFKKVQDLFGEKDKDLADEFLIFMSAGEAAEMGLFMDHLMMKQFTKFLQLVQVSFERKPTLLRRVMRAIANSANCGNVAEAKSKVLPHFRSNPRLAEMFRSFFPDERPPESTNENDYETLNEDFLTKQENFEVWEMEDDNDNPRNKDTNKLDSVYLQGRVFLQYGRNLRPARVSFPFSKEPYRWHVKRLSTDPLITTPDAQPSSPKKNKNNPNTKTKKAQNKKDTPKDVNDNTKSKNEQKGKQKGSKAKANPKKAETEKEPASKKRGLTNENKKDEASKAKQSKLDLAQVKKDAKSHSSDNKKESKQFNESKKESKTDSNDTKKDTKILLKQIKKDKQIINMCDSKTENKDVTKLLTTDTKRESKKDSKLDLSVTKKDTKLGLSVTKKDSKVNLSITNKTTKNKVNSWTRDEDKTMLETIKVESMNDEVFIRIKDLLPHRSISEIKERFFHVMNLLKQMSIGEVT